MATEYYYARDGQRFGPVTGSQLRRLAGSGQLLPLDQIWVPEKNQWLLARSIKALFPTAAADVGSPIPAQVSGRTKDRIKGPIPGVSNTRSDPHTSHWGRGLVFGGAALGVVGLLIGLALVFARTVAIAQPDTIAVADVSDGEPSGPLPVSPDAGQQERIVPEGEKADQKQQIVERKKEPVAEPVTRENPAADSKLEQGNAAMARGDLDGAIRFYTEAIELRPKFAWAYCKRGQAQMNKGAFPAAIADCDKALELDPKLIDAYAFRAASEYDGKNYPAAIATADLALKLQPEASFFYFLRGNALVMTDSAERGMQDLDRAINLDPRNARYYHSRGSAHEKLGHVKEAQADFEQRDALELAAMSPAKRAALARLQQAEANYRLAAAQYEGAQRAYDVARNTFAAQAGRAAAMGIRMQPPQPPDPLLERRLAEAESLAHRARREYESTP